eukprot:6199027-Pleurochrysis_carterae.AAC.4
MLVTRRQPGSEPRSRLISLSADATSKQTRIRHRRRNARSISYLSISRMKKGDSRTFFQDEKAVLPHLEFKDAPTED